MRVAIAISLAIALSGCATTFRLQPQVASDQAKSINYGRDVIISKKRNTVKVWPQNFLDKSTEKFAVMVAVVNDTDRPILLSANDIKATFNGKPIATFTADEVVAEIDKRERFATALAAFGGALSAAGASQSGGRIRESGQVSGYTSSGQYYSGTYTASGYSQSQAQSAVNAANAQTTRNIASIGASASSEREKVQGPRLRSHSIKPGSDFEGAIYFENITPSGNDRGNLVITILVDNEVHTFNMGVEKVNL